MRKKIVSRRKHHRLAPFLYADPVNTLHLITVTRDKFPYFEHPPFAAVAARTLEERAAKHAVPLYAYAIMHEHVHVVMSPSKTCNAAKLMGQFKNLTLRRLQKIRPELGRVWTDGYYDRFVRPHQEIEDLIRYVLFNPVRKGFVTTWEEYPFTGPRNDATIEIGNRMVERSPTSCRIER